MAWEPILEGDAAAEARTAVEAVADALTSDDPTFDVGDDASYAGGHSGLALLHAYRAADAQDEKLAELADKHLDRAIECVAERATMPGFYSGFTGVAWTMQHIEGLLSEDPVPPDLCEEIDRALADHVSLSPWYGDYDLISGLVGFGCYVIDHVDRSYAVDTMTRIVTRLGELAQERDGGLTWWTSPQLMIPRTAAEYPDGYYNLGLAHGVPGVLAILGRAIAEGIAVDEATRLLDGGVTWLLAHRNQEDGSAWGYYAGGEKKSRSAWCYGDPGVAASLLCAAQSVGNDDWAQVAIEVALADVDRPMDKVGVVDAGLCHGSAGLGILYDRMFHATERGEFADAARRWYQHALDARVEGEGVAGFRSWAPTPGDMETLSWQPESGFLTGAAGIALALLGGVSTVEPNWDLPLLIAAPRRAE